MTLPVERTRSLIYARDFLLSLLCVKQTPKVPRAVRREAAAQLRHYPTKWEIEQIPTGRAKIYFGQVE